MNNVLIIFSEYFRSSNDAVSQFWLLTKHCHEAFNWKIYTIAVQYRTYKQGNIITLKINLLYNIAISWQRVKMMLCRDMKFKNICLARRNLDFLGGSMRNRKALQQGTGSLGSSPIFASAAVWTCGPHFHM